MICNRSKPIIIKKPLLLPITLLCYALTFAQPPANDDIQNATDITSIPYVEPFVRTAEATIVTDGDLPDCTIATFGYTTVHYRFAPANDTSLKIQLGNGNLYSFIIVTRANVPIATSYNDIVLDNDNNCNFNSEITYNFIGGQVYYIIIHNSANTSITFSDASVNYDITFADNNLKNALLNSYCVFQDVNVNDVDFASSSSNLVDNRTNADFNNDGEIQTYEAELINGLHLRNKSISNLSGLEFFPNLYFLEINDNNITDISLLSNLDLQVLDCRSNPLPASLNFAQNNELIVLRCGNASLTSLDVSQNTLLKKLDSSSEENSQLNTIDISANTQLESLWHQNSQMNTIDLSNNLNLKELKLLGNNFSSIDVSQLANLEYLDISYNTNFTTIDITQNPQLKRFVSYNNELNSIDVSQNSLLTELTVSTNQLTAIDVTQNPLIESLFFQGNQLTSLDVTQNPNLKYLNAIDNQISNFDFSQNLSMQSMGVSKNPITTLDVTNLSNLGYIEASNTLLTTLDLSQNTSLFAFEIEDNYFLESLNIRNGNNSQITSVNFRLTNTPNLQAICVDDISYADANFFDKGPNAYFTEDCAAVTTPQNLVTGNVSLDSNSNGCTSGAISLQNIMVTASTTSSSFTTFSNSAGEYAMALPEGNYSIFTTFDSSEFTVNPANISQNFAGLGSNSTENDFCVDSNTSNSDVNIIILPVSETRPGFDTAYQIVYQNAGSILTSGSITFEFDDTLQNFITASPSESSISSNTITFDFVDLLPFETRTIDIAMNTNPPPIVNGDDILSFTASINPNTTETNLEDNQYILTEVVVNSFDPNDKQVLEGEQILPEQVDEFLHYLVRFQNTGTASAINVIITDELDDKLDWATLRPVSASHAYTTRIINGNFLEFSFLNINLPDSTTDEPNSHGFIAFKVKPKNNVVVGDIITGEAKIYFDYNAPIITNEVSTEIANVLSIEDNNHIKAFTVYPNPTEDIVTINSKYLIENITIVDINGKVLKPMINSHSSNQFQLNVSTLPDGLYFINIETDLGTMTQKIIKQ